MATIDSVLIPSDWIDRFGRAPLLMAAFQVLVYFVVLMYGVWPPSLGTHLVLIGLAMTAAFGGMIWLTLTRPWEPTRIKPDERGGGAARYLWDHGLIVGVTWGIAHLYRRVIGSAKDTLREFANEGEIRTVQDVLAQNRIAEEMESWAADPWGVELVSGGGVVIVLLLPAALLLILWAFLPR